MTFPENVTSIGQYALSGCSYLTRINVKATLPPTGGTKMFDSTNNCNIYIPTGTMDKYSAASIWSGYVSRMVETTF